MVTLVKRDIQKEVFPHLNDDFEKYLKQQQLRTTFNGLEIAAFSWYKRLFGLK